MYKFRKQQRRGAAAVEFAMVAPVMFLILLGMMEFGRIMMIQHVLTMASREGAREAILLGASQSSVESTITDYTDGIIPSENLIISISSDPQSAHAGDLITASVSTPVSAISAFGAKWFDGSVVAGTTTMRKEGID